jgi:c-di-GMP-binding flagellar brake protein YcgR
MIGTESQRATVHLDQQLPLRINDRLQICVKRDGEEVPSTYFSRVEDTQENSIVVAWPTQGGTRAPIRDNMLLSLSFAADGSVYSFEARVAKRIQVPLPMLVLSTEGVVRRVQRRDFVRIPATLDVFLVARVVKVRSGADSKADVNFITARTVDISGGGFAIHHPAPPKLGDLYDVRLSIPGKNESLALTAKVVRAELIGNPMNQLYYDLGFCFVQMKESIRRQIITFIFEYQRKSRVG